ncbi:juvenile hormone acid O-methyltransferase-like [Ixodes scapularis]|uniref:juvenile hormone acid O-methyltransferase-like n=1 Tax=Ixodes scapularis TaxID=6945 RepID=UPI001A9DA37B|nr:juvenile hormone acid O-methyltransferase-like [Ixodes scapularis]
MSVQDETSSRTLEPDEYVVNNEIQRRNSIHALELLEGSFGSEDTSDEQFLDVGCGPGDFTRDCLLPRCPPCRRIMAVDVSEDMVKYAREHFAHPKICYDVLDIASEDVSDFVERHGEFDRVYSFFCLHWMKDQATVLKNVARMIKPGGGCLLLFNASSPTMRFHKKMAAMDRWQKYREILEKPIPPSVDIADEGALISYIKGLLKTADLTPTRCEVQRMEHTFPSLENLIAVQMSYNLLKYVVTEEESPLLLKDVTEESTKWWAEKDAGDSPLDGQVFLVHAYKPRSPTVFTAM